MWCSSLCSSRDEFNEEDWKLVQLVLTLFRNLLAIHDISPLQKAGESTCYFLSLRDQFLELLSRENVMDIFIVLTQTIECNNLLRHDNLLLLEIYHYILLGQDMELIALAPEKVGLSTGSIWFPGLKRVSFGIDAVVDHFVLTVGSREKGCCGKFEEVNGGGGSQKKACKTQQCKSASFTIWWDIHPSYHGIVPRDGS